MKALYDFVNKKIKYFSLAFVGLSDYDPHTPEDVLQRGFGDCKDKDTLLRAMLEAEGMKASSVLVNPLRQLDPEMPSPWPFTHVITLLHLGKTEIWVDSTGTLPFRSLPPAIREKKGLVIPVSGKPYFEEIPGT